MPACPKCYISGRRPAPRCPEGKRIHDKVRQARKAFEAREGTYEQWQQAWKEWELHYRGKKKKKPQNKQTEF